MTTCRLYIVDTHAHLSRDVIEKLYGIQNSSDVVYQQHLDGYIKTAKLLGVREVNPPPSLLSLYKKWAVQDAGKCSVERLSNVWNITDPDLKIDSIGPKTKKISEQLIRHQSTNRPLYAMYIVWDPRIKFAVAVYTAGELVFMHVSDNNSILHIDHQCNAELLCMILEKPLCPNAYAYCNEHDPTKALYFFTCLMGFCPV